MLQPTITRSDLEYDLPPALVAQSPSRRRDDARMLIVSRESRSFQDSSVRNLVERLRHDDLLVLNDTRVLPARFTAFRRTGGRVDGLFLEEISPGRWIVMLEGSRRLRPGEAVLLTKRSDALEIRLGERLGEGRWQVEALSQEAASSVLERLGRPPLPPYIGRKKCGGETESVDRERYQTVYARCPGAVAAPTAGLHLTKEMLDALSQRGVNIAFVTLHVGAGTFKPVEAEDLTAHAMHSESYQLPDDTVDAWRECRSRGGRVVAVGTTVVRVLESVLGEGMDAGVRRGSTRLFIYPPYRITTVDALLTNFHLPSSTLLALVMAFAGVELTRQAYQHAITQQYRFYSYGDAMLIESSLV